MEWLPPKMKTQNQEEYMHLDQNMYLIIHVYYGSVVTDNIIHKSSKKLNA